MYLQVETINEKIFNEALRFFDEKYKKELKKKPTFKESLVARYLIHNSAKYKIDEKIFSSISHKENLVFIGISNNNIGVDIEVLKKRDISLLKSFKDDEYKLLGGQSWENFYYLWTAKESIIKLEGLVLDKINNISLTKCKQNDKSICEIEFSKKMSFTYNNKGFTVLSGKSNDKIFSIVY